MGTATLHCLPSDCQITLFDKPDITDEENPGASSYLELGRTYTLKEFMKIRRKLDNLGYDNREPVDIRNIYIVSFLSYLTTNERTENPKGQR